MIFIGCIKTTIAKFKWGIRLDQWGNIVTGTELIRRMEGGSAFAITSPLIKSRWFKIWQNRIW